MVEVLLKALKDKKDHAHIEKTLPVFFREWQGGFALINSATTVDDCKDYLDNAVLHGVKILLNTSHFKTHQAFKL